MRHLILFLSFIFATSALADSPQITGIKANSSANGWRFDVTILHPDTGWEDYADGWRVELSDGSILGTRELLHPHVNEQPFTRSLSSVLIPEGTTTVYLRARDNVGGWAEQTTAYELP